MRNPLRYFMPTISVLFVLVALFLFLIRNETFKIYYGLNFATFNEEDQIKNGFTTRDYFASKKLDSFSMTKNQIENQEILREINEKVGLLVKSKDTTIVIYVKLNEKTKYEEWVRLIEICQNQKTGFYASKDYEFWISNRKNKKLEISEVE